MEPLKTRIAKKLKAEFRNFRSIGNKIEINSVPDVTAKLAEVGYLSKIAKKKRGDFGNL